MTVLAMFLLGLYAGKIGVFERNTPHLKLIKKVWLGALLLGIPLVALLAAFLLSWIGVGIQQEMAIQLVTSLSGVTLCFFCMSSLRL
ncbi:DUF418 domain-containing protein [Domibacillus sp. DTU_2020_1001157_1_SI_ALB_TIR_016]|uniref:DUF418 domain-containing protein n=1 Tax=Domibacillus sp. DTU_2020_1001157_1_SI_ALB_TIR_016 TaxID=3077789 RepID=UPI0028E728DC|nr:DUF418 domain-containing protein [Domibacillus sp. DTU_2020_1001157_1_SI_ALB_TIR_016]WNS79374.1 DUF418 domain-containing protein [Domibacillus sp. DTU_2020_1001157_1_SI_ALB_TIR_016]